MKKLPNRTWGHGITGRLLIYFFAGLLISIFWTILPFSNKIYLIFAPKNEALRIIVSIVSMIGPAVLIMSIIEMRVRNYRKKHGYPVNENIERILINEENELYRR